MSQNLKIDLFMKVINFSFQLLIKTIIYIELIIHVLTIPLVLFFRLQPNNISVQSFGMVIFYVIFLTKGSVELLDSFLEKKAVKNKFLFFIIIPFFYMTFSRYLDLGHHIFFNTLADSFFRLKSVYPIDVHSIFTFSVAFFLLIKNNFKRKP